jgi:hypothetical protein
LSVSVEPSFSHTFCPAPGADPAAGAGPADPDGATELLGAAEAELAEGAPDALCGAEPESAALEEGCAAVDESVLPDPAEPDPESDGLEEGCAAAGEPVLPDEGSVEEPEVEALEGGCVAAEVGAVDGVCWSAELSDVGAAELGPLCWPADGAGTLTLTLGGAPLGCG